jgi:hypothetical protein
MTTFGRRALYVDNFTSPNAPTVNDDINQGYTIGSTWFDTATLVFYRCTNNASGAATWVAISATQIGGQNILASILGANMNTTADQVFVGNVNLTTVKFAISKILVTNCSGSITTAAGGIYSAATKGGTPIVAAAQTYTGTGATSLQSLTIAAAGSAAVWSVAPILSLTTGEGVAQTADFYLIGDILPT